MTDMAQHFTTPKLLKFTLPVMAMMIFTSIYSVVDGFFVSNFAGKIPFAAVNLTFPLIMILSTVGFMVGTGGSAIVAYEQGEGKPDRANRHFTLLIAFAAVLGLIFSIVGFVVVEPFCRAYGAQGEFFDQCMLYAKPISLFLVFFVLQIAFQSFVIASGKPNLAFAITVAGGVVNILLDALFICVMGMGVLGAALGTGIGCVVGAGIPLIYYARENSSSLRFAKPTFEGAILGKASVNGSSEMVSNIAFSLVDMLYNMQLMALIGEDGVAAYGVIAYVMFIFGAILIGYSMGSAPLMSYQHGAGNAIEKHSLWKKSIIIVGIGGFIMWAVAQLLTVPITNLFVGYDPALAEITRHGFELYSWAFILMGFCIYASSLFTSLGSGLISALISFLRTLVFEVAAIMLLPLVLGVDGIWLAAVVAEAAAFILSWAFMLAFGRKFGFLGAR